MASVPNNILALRKKSLLWQAFAGAKNKQKRIKAHSMWDEGFTKVEIAAYFNVLPHMISRLAVKCKWVIRHPDKRGAVVLEGKRVYNLYVQQKQTSKEIAKIYGCSNVTVLNFLRKLEIPIRHSADAQSKGRFDTDFYKECKRLYLSGLSFDSIARQFKTAAHRLSKVAKKEGWFRTKSDWVREFLYEEMRHRRERDAERKLEGVSYVVSFQEFNSVISYLTKLVRPQISKRPAPFRGNVLYHLDHRFSKHDAYYFSRSYINPPTVYEISHPCNLQWLKETDNLVKSHKSDITLSKLRHRIQKYNAKFGDPFEDGISRGASGLYYPPLKYI